MTVGLCAAAVTVTGKPPPRIHRLGKTGRPTRTWAPQAASGWEPRLPVRGFHDPRGTTSSALIRGLPLHFTAGVKFEQTQRLGVDA